MQLPQSLIGEAVVGVTEVIVSLLVLAGAWGLWWASAVRGERYRQKRNLPWRTGEKGESRWMG